MLVVEDGDTTELAPMEPLYHMDGDVDEADEADEAAKPDEDDDWTGMGLPALMKADEERVMRNLIEALLS